MKLVRFDQKQFVFELGRREKRALFELLKLYPLVPVAHHRLSKSVKASIERDENQRLLEEALAAQREENRKRMTVMLNGPEHFEKTEDGWRFTLASNQIEWLLQILNDVNVGSWLALGSPDSTGGWKTPMEATQAAHFWAMEMACDFERMLIEAMNGRAPREV